MVGVRKGIEVFFTKNDLKYLDDLMPDFSLRKKEDQKRKSQDVSGFPIVDTCREIAYVFTRF